MSVKTMFFKPLDRPINGVVKADQSDDATVYQELEEYVVTKELEKHFRGFFESYSTDLNDPSIANRVGVWISGFFGSGKSHFLKILSYLLANIEARDAAGQPQMALSFFGEDKVRDAMIRADMGKSVAHSADAILFNIDSKASSNNSGNPILNVFLRVFNEHQGFSSDHPHIAHMERHLSERGVYADFKQVFQDICGSPWEEERDAYHFHQDDIEQAVAKTLQLSPEAAHKWFEDSESTFSVSVENFCHWVKDYLKSKGDQHRVLFLVDEVGQFIGKDTKLMLTLQTITENLGTICQGRAWIIVTSQADMDAVLGELSASKANDFSKIAGRFKTRLSLSSSNTDEVIQKRLLRKTPEAAKQLEQLYVQQGDILRNQISFDRTGPTLKNFDGPESFVSNYPFAPYHFQLVQKVFEEIRKVGATGAHLAYGERSMLDAFQLAARSVEDQEVGVLVPMHRFYESVEGFLDTAVKRTIDQAQENNTLEDLDVQMLRTLFMIRYVDLVKGTLDNLVTLSIEQIDDDKLALRRRIEDSLQRLEKESLITRNGDEVLFLTNEERDITRKIKQVEISSAEENKELAQLLFKDLLRDQNKYRYPLNKHDYTIGRYLDQHTLDGKYESDLRIEVISAQGVDYRLYNTAGAITKSTEGNGQALFVLSDDREFFMELRTWLRTNKYIRLNDDASQLDITRILADRGRENQERKKRLKLKLEALWLEAEVYALGQHLSLSNQQVMGRLDEVCHYLLENTYNKLIYLKTLQKEPLRELKAVLLADDVDQLGLNLDGDEANLQAVKEVEQFITYKAADDRMTVTDMVNRFAGRPYGWPDGETLLIIGRLAALGRISFHTAGPTLPLSEVFDYLTNSRKRQEISVQKKRQTDDIALKKARQLSKELFSELGPEGEKELFSFYQNKLNEWKSNLSGYKKQMAVGQFPGKAVVEQSLLLLERTLSHEDSFDFFKTITTQQNDYLDLEEDYRDQHEFFTRQLSIWQQLQAALVRFGVNRQALERNDKALAALQALEQIRQSEAPYNRLHKVTGLIAEVEAVNSAELSEKRSHAIERVEEHIAQLRTEIDNSGIATPELNNCLLSPLQNVKRDLETETSIAAIFMLQAETARNHLDEALDQLTREINAEHERLAQLAKQAELKAQQAAAKAASKTGTAGVSPGANRVAEPAPPPAPKPQPKPKPVVDVDVQRVFSKNSSGVYLETTQDVEQFIRALQDELSTAIQAEKRVRIR